MTDETVIHKPCICTSHLVIEWREGIPIHDYCHVCKGWRLVGFAPVKTIYVDWTMPHWRTTTSGTIF